MIVNHCPICGAVDGVIFHGDGWVKECKNCDRIENEEKIGNLIDSAKEMMTEIELLVCGHDTDRDHPELRAKFLDLATSATYLHNLWNRDVTKELAVLPKPRGYELARCEVIGSNVRIGHIKVIEEPNFAFPLPGQSPNQVLDRGNLDENGDFPGDPEFGPD
jgi:hypothetical protein